MLLNTKSLELSSRPTGKSSGVNEFTKRKKKMEDINTTLKIEYPILFMWWANVFTSNKNLQFYSLNKT